MSFSDGSILLHSPSGIVLELGFYVGESTNDDAISDIFIAEYVFYTLTSTETSERVVISNKVL